MTAVLGLKIEPGGGHRSPELRRILEETRIQDEITICRVGSDSEIGGPCVEIDGLRPGQDDSVNVGCQRCQGVEENTPCGYISLVEPKWLRASFAPLIGRLRRRGDPQARTGASVARSPASTR